MFECNKQFADRTEVTINSIAGRIFAKISNRQTWARQLLKSRSSQTTCLFQASLRSVRFQLETLSLVINYSMWLLLQIQCPLSNLLKRYFSVEFMMMKKTNSFIFLVIIKLLMEHHNSIHTCLMRAIDRNCMRRQRRIIKYIPFRCKMFEWN